MKKTIVFLGMAACLWLSSTQAKAGMVTVGFENISANSVGDAAIGEAQMSVTLTDELAGLAADEVAFIFSNSGPAASSITQVYFEDGTLLSLARLIDADDGIGGDPGVDYSIGASPPNLPAANNASPPFQVTAGFLADPDPPTQPNGVNPGESLTVIFQLLPGLTYSDAEAALSIDPILSGSLRIGIHVQGYASGGSETFVNVPPETTTPGPNLVPEPSSWALMAIGMIGLAFHGWKKRKRAVA